MSKEKKVEETKQAIAALQAKLAIPAYKLPIPVTLPCKPTQTPQSQQRQTGVRQLS